MYMSDFIRVSAIKDSLIECPICTKHFNDTGRIPRRLPCCVQSICQLCLQQLYNAGIKLMSCPLCRQSNQLPEGVTSLPTEPIILKILDHLKIQKGLHLPCTDCPDKNEAIVRCDDCCVFLCEECHRAHARHRYSRDHKTVTIEEMKSRPVESFRRLHQCKEHQKAHNFFCHTCAMVICVSCTVVEHDKGKGHNVVSVDEAHQDKATATDDTLSKLDEKVEKLSQSVRKLQKKKQNIQTSRQKATYDVNQTFDNLIELIQNRRAILLSQVEDQSSKSMKLTEQASESTTTLLTKVRSSSEYTRQMRGRADKIEDLQLMVSLTDTLTTMLEETPQDVEFDRTGITFVPAEVEQVTLNVEAIGAIRTVNFKPTERPKGVLVTDLYNGITLVPAELPKVPDVDMNIPGEVDIFCPHLEWESNTASDDVTISGSLITNTEPVPTPQDTGCRIQAERLVMASRPLVIRRGLLVMYHVKVRFSITRVTEEKKMIFELALTNSPVDANRAQNTGLSVRVVACSTHNQQLCLRVVYDGKLLTDVSIIRNQVGESRDLHLCFLLDGDNNKIHVVDVDDVKVVQSVTNAVFDRPLWVMMCVDIPLRSDMRGELISGNKVIMTQEITKLLSSLH